MVLSCIGIISFAGNDNLLPASISEFTSGTGVTTHDHLVYLNESHIYNKGIVDNALNVNYQSYAAGYTTPMWLLGSYIKSFAQSNTADSYTVFVSLDVKGSITSAKLAVRRYGEATDSKLATVCGSTACSADNFTTLAGTFELTSAQALAAESTWYALCLDGIVRPSALGGIRFDNVVLKITPKTENKNNLLPESISTFKNGVTSDTHLVYLNDSHIYSKSVSNEALSVAYYGYAADYTSPMWLLGSYIKSFAQANTADSYKIKVSLDVKGSITSANLMIRRFGEVSDSKFKAVASGVACEQNMFTTLSGEFELTSAQALAAQDSWYALCISNIVRPAALGSIVFDNATLEITPVTQQGGQQEDPGQQGGQQEDPGQQETPSEPQRIGVLPAAISTFDDGVAVTEHQHLTYVNDSHIYTKIAKGGTLTVNYYGYAAAYTSPMWLLGSYIKDYAQKNKSNNYTVSVSMDVKGSLESAMLSVRRFGNASDSSLKNISQSVTFASESFTNVSGKFTLNAETALAAEDSWYGICLSSIKRPAALGGIVFDNVKVEITADGGNAGYKKVTNGDAENGLENWNIFSQGGGKIELSDDTASGKGHSVKYSNPTNAYGSIAFDLGPMVINDKAHGYAGGGAATYEITFKAKASDVTGARIFLNSQAHTAKTYVSASPYLTLTDEWEEYTVEVEVTDDFLKEVEAQYKAGKTEAYELILRFDLSATMYKGDKSGTYWVDDVTIKNLTNPENTGDNAVLTVCLPAVALLTFTVFAVTVRKRKIGLN